MNMSLAWRHVALALQGRRGTDAMSIEQGGRETLHFTLVRCKIEKLVFYVILICCMRVMRFNYSSIYYHRNG